MDKQELEHTLSFFKLLSIMDLSESSQGLTCSLTSSGCHHWANTLRRQQEHLLKYRTCIHSSQSFESPQQTWELIFGGFFFFFQPGSSKCSVVWMCVSVFGVFFLCFPISSPSIFYTSWLFSLLIPVKKLENHVLLETTLLSLAFHRHCHPFGR